MRYSVLAVGMLAACSGSPPDYVGTDMYAMFPFDGVRTWEFISTDQTLRYKLIAQMRSTEPDVHEDGHNTYPVDYLADCVQEGECSDGLVRTIVWANDEVDGTFIYEWTEGAGAGGMVFDPPLMIADVEMKRGDVIETQTGGATWTSTLESFEGCPVRMQVDWSCARIVLDDGDGNPETGKGLAGTYWATVGYNVVAIAHDGDSTWQLSKQFCEEDCTGVW